MKVLFLNIDDYRRLFHLRLEALDRKQQIETKEKARKRREERIEKGIW